ncbi:YciI family protein [Arthrobacter rhombi]|uniref:YciI family protein n=1 Tax=Arthrobacter rhombi TaxID=71253 RepID=UPI003FD2D5A5
MTHYLVSFDDGDKNFPKEDLPAVGAASHAVIRQAQEAGVWVFGGGIGSHDVSVVDTDGSVATPRITEHIGGFSIIDVASDEAALSWAGRIAAACRCAQQVRQIMDDPDVCSPSAIPIGGRSTSVRAPPG